MVKNLLQGSIITKSEQIYIILKNLSAVIFPEMLKIIIEEGNYLPVYIFNVHETGLFWENMPESI